MNLLIAVVFLALILYNLGAALYFMMVDKGDSDRMVNALTRRIALSIGFIVLVMIGIWTGVVHPHGVS